MPRKRNVIAKRSKKAHSEDHPTITEASNMQIVAIEANKDMLLMRLPPEIRNDIFRQVLVEPGHVKIHNDSECSWRPPGLLQTCKALRKEGAAIYYGSHTFKVSCSKSIAQWAGKLSPNLTLCFRDVRDMQCNEIFLGMSAAAVLTDYRAKLVAEGILIAEGALSVPVSRMTWSTDASGEFQTGHITWVWYNGTSEELGVVCPD